MILDCLISLIHSAGQNTGTLGTLDTLGTLSTMAHSTTTTFAPLTREDRRHAANAKICDFANSHREHFSSSDVKNGQGQIVIYAIHKLMDTNRGGVTLYKVADFIRENELWFKLSIKDENGVFIVGTGSLEPYVDEIDGVKVPTMYSRDKVMRDGRSRISNFIMNKIKSNVLTPTRAHNLIRRLVDHSGQETYSVHFPKYLPPSNLSTEKASKLNRMMRQPEMSQRDQDFFECW